MRKFRSIIRFWSLIVTLVLPTLCLAQPLAIIVHSSNQTDDLSSQELFSLYSGQTRVWANGQKVLLVSSAADSEPWTRFSRLILEPLAGEGTSTEYNAKLSPYRFVAPSEAATIRFVSSLENAIGIVSLRSLRNLAPPNNQAKVLLIDGRLPTDAGYRLR